MCCGVSKKELRYVDYAGKPVPIKSIDEQINELKNKKELTMDVYVAVLSDPTREYDPKVIAKGIDGVDKAYIDIINKPVIQLVKEAIEAGTKQLKMSKAETVEKINHLLMEEGEFGLQDWINESNEKESKNG